MQMQIKRQREFWHLLKIACDQDWSWTKYDTLSTKVKKRSA
ncbi:hypothetical protein CRUP_008447 [Coryphaenoides rupestris]|nr:hypothetical protein CRUP_008447 [Coryphaenoides rupestris]